ASVIALVATVTIVGAKPVWMRLRELDAGWVAVGLAITAVQFVLMALRWWFLARRLGLPLSYPRALREYYASTLLNNVVPFGGDAFRAVRHADVARSSRERPFGPVVSAILLERTSGQLAVWLVVVAVAPDLLRHIALSTKARAPAEWIAA